MYDKYAFALQAVQEKLQSETQKAVDKKGGITKLKLPKLKKQK